MIRPCLLATAILSCLATTTTALRYCSYIYLTTDPLGGAEITPITCTAATAATKCIGGLNAQCMFSVRSYSYICCFAIAAQTFATPDPGSTFATVTPGNIGVTVTPQNQKPICPNGALSSAGSNAIAVACNTSDVNQGCMSAYSCVKAANVYDFYGTPTVTSDDFGAGLLPYVCCKTTTLTAFSNAFTENGLSPTIIPTAPTSGIVSMHLPAAATAPPAARDIFLGDDYSFSANQLTKAPDSVTLFSKTLTAPNVYHILFFDTVTNKDCLFVGNIPGDGTYTVKIGTGPIVTASGTTAYGGTQVFYDSASASYKLNTTPATYMAVVNPSQTGHRWAMLVFQTSAALNFGAAPFNTADATKILIGAGPFGDFDPMGKFTTVTAFLNGKGKLLGSPIAGSYFTFKN